LASNSRAVLKKLSAFKRLYLETWWAKGALGPLLGSAPAAALGYAAIDNDFLATLAAHKLVALLLAISGLVLNIGRGLLDFVNTGHPISQRSLLLLLACIDHVVGRKMQRFGEFANKVSRNGSLQRLTRGEVFMTITKPEEQIQTITQQVWQYFYGIRSDPDVEIRVVLARMGTRYIEAFESYVPADHPPRTPLSDLQNDKAGFSQALKDRRIVILPDVRSEASRVRGRFASTVAHDDDDDGGSLICWPVTCHHTQRIPFVISIYATRAQYFSNTKRKEYEYVLGVFSKRLTIEHNLHILKGLAQ
jgi:hypothetical protein